jgi:hypothetical protein
VKNQPPQDHIRSYDAAMDKALAVVCACVAIPALLMIGALVWAILDIWQRRAGA